MGIPVRVVNAVFVAMILAACLFFSHANAIGGEDPLDRIGGRMEVMGADGNPILLPQVKTDIEARVTQDLVTVTVRQEFVNPGDKPVHAKYLFPLNKDAAVYAMTMETEDEVVRARIKKVEEAKKTFEKAKREGKNAALLRQHRPNMFTQDVANLMPQKPILVTLKYVQPAPRVDGKYELVFPLVVGPRFQPPGAGVPPAAQSEDGEAAPVPAKPSESISSSAPFGQWELETLPAYPPVAGLDLPKTIARDRVSLRVLLEGSQRFQDVESRTHAIVTIPQEDGSVLITLAKGRVLGNCDLVVTYRLADKNVSAGVDSAMTDQGGFFSILVEPPETVKDEAVSAREMVFVLDVSGSMTGKPINASKAFMLKALENLRPKDTFRVVIFENQADEYSAVPLEATPENIERAKNYVRGLSAGGGTMMRLGIEKAFAPPVPYNTVRMVVFLTDGYIGNEAEILSLINKKIGEARLFAFGIGTGTNRYLMSEMGRMGRGFARIVPDTENARAAAADFEKRLNAPVLTDIKVDFGDLMATDVVPTVIPDLFMGDSIRVMGRYDRPGEYEIAVTGKIAGKAARLPMKVRLAGEGEGNPAIALTWARTAIKDNMDAMNRPLDHQNRQEILDGYKDKVTDLGLEFSLVTKWTSFVAVAEKVVNEDATETEEKGVPLPMVKNVTEKAYPQACVAAPAQNNFCGASTPEPASTGGLFLAAAAGAAAIRRRRRKKG